MLCMLKKKKYVLAMFQDIDQIKKTKKHRQAGYFFNDYKRGRMVLSCSKKTIIKRHIIKKKTKKKEFLLFKFSSSF